MELNFLYFLSLRGISRITAAESSQGLHRASLAPGKLKKNCHNHNCKYHSILLGNTFADI